MRTHARRMLAVVAQLTLLCSCATAPSLPMSAHAAPKARLPVVDVMATRETMPVGTSNDDAADDVAIWRNPADPLSSWILGTDKKAGLYVYGLDGAVKDFAAAGALNNVDVRAVTAPSGTPLVLVGASDRTDTAEPRIALFALDSTSGKLESLGSEAFLPAGHGAAEAYGFCMGAGQGDDALARAYVVMKDGTIVEAKIVASASGYRPIYVQSFKLASQSEGCVVDDATGALYVAEEDVGIWRFDLTAAQPVAQRFASVSAQHGLVDDVEGLAIAGAYLVASSQGDDAYAVFDKTTAKLVGRFRIATGALGGTSDTDGIEVALGDFGREFPFGIFVAQDGDNAPHAQNFKMVSWANVLAALKRR